MPVLTVVSDNLSPGSVPAYEVPEDWPFPVFVVWKDGSQIHLLPRARRVILPEFEIAGTRQEVKDRIGLVLTSLVLAAGFAGRATVAVRSDYVMSTDAGPLHVLNLGVMFTADMDDEEPDAAEAVRWSAPSGWRPDGFPELEEAADALVDGFAVASVMLS